MFSSQLMIPNILKHALLIGFLGSTIGSTIGCRSVDSPSFIQSSVTSITPDSAETSITQPTSDRASNPESTPDAPSRWPTRWGNNPDHPGIIIKLDPAEQLQPVHYARHHQSRSTQIEYDDANTLAAKIGITTGFKFKPEGPGAFVFVPKSDPDKDSDQETPADPNTPDLAFKFVSATRASNQDIKPALPKAKDPYAGYQVYAEPKDSITSPPIEYTPDQDHVILQRTWFTYRDPKDTSSEKHNQLIPADDPANDQADDSTDDPTAHAKGTIVLLPGMFGTPELIVSAFERYWVAQGYAVILMRSQPSRFSEHHMFNTAPGLAMRIADKVASMNDERVAEGAYSTKAAVEYVHTQRPTLKDKPTVLIGMSGGAIMLPTVYAYAPDLYDASVLIAGGANNLRIAIESNYKSWIDAITFDFDPDPSTRGSIAGQHLENFSANYLKESKLDAYHTATEMQDTPVLMLHASNDKAVPAYTGQLLYHQLGKPERWSYPVGHELIFIGLPTQITRIDRWITQQLE